MSEPNAPEPTMEEILASIRRIISEDEPTAAAPAVEPEPEPAPTPAAVHTEHEDVLELTDPVKDEPAPLETHGDLDIHALAHPEPTPPARTPAPPPATFAPPPPLEEPLVGGEAAGAAASAFGQLAQHVALPGQGRTLEDLVRELVRPLLKSWLDANLPAIVQAKVEEEVERIARRRGL